uniref:Biogenesis of lysosome-related organelles complex 1 subunit 7 n=1 Tax=Peronospora matthiolae TaxID=2874970 RepID=A0AAV1UUR4_9STRA
MASTYGGRVLAGEDSEEDDEDDEEMGLQFKGFGSRLSPAAPRFTVPTVNAVPHITKDYDNEAEEDEEEEEESDGEMEVEELKVMGWVRPQDEQKRVDEHDEEDRNDAEKSAGQQESKGAQLLMKEDAEHKRENGEQWQLAASMNGIDVMSNAFVDIVQPSLDGTIHRITELKESQQRLLQMLTSLNAGVQTNERFANAAAVLDKLPFYSRKLQGITMAMQEISTSTARMKRRTESLRIDAQSHAISKENKRDAQSQWNKLYAAKSASAPSSQS